MYLKNHTSLYSKVFIRILTYTLGCFEQGNFVQDVRSCFEIDFCWKQKVIWL